MKSRKLVALITSAALSVSMLAPSIISNAEQLKHEAKPVTKQVSTNKTEQVSQQELMNAVMTSVQQNDSTVQKVNIITGKVIQTTKPEKERALSTLARNSARHNEGNGFAVNFHGYKNETQYNKDHLHQLKNGVNFASQINKNLYDQMLSPNNRWNAEKEAINLHGENRANDCAFFVSSALRQIGVSIPQSTANCWTLQNNLSNLGWTQQSNLGNMQPGAIAFAGQNGDAHTYIFMGWADSAHNVAWVVDSQFSWFGTNDHVRGTEGPSLNGNISPTAFYYTAPGGAITSNVNPNGNTHPNYKSYGIGNVNVGSLNVRSQPNTNCNIIGSVYNGELVQILAQEGNWDKINYNGQIGYVYAPYVTGSGPAHPNNVTVTNHKPAPQPQHQSPSSNYNINIVNDHATLSSSSDMWVMSGPGFDYNHIATINPNQRVAVTGYSGSWARIVCAGGTVGWVPSAQVHTYNNPSKIGGWCFGFTPYSGEWIFSQPSGSSQHIATFKNGQKCIAINNENGWTKVVSGGNVGWIPTQYLIQLGNYTPTQTKYLYKYDTNQVSTYTGTNARGAVASIVPNNTPVLALGTSNGFTEVVCGNTPGWVPTSELYNTKVNPIKSGNFGTGYLSSGSDLWVFSAPGWGNIHTDTLPKNTPAAVIKESNGWVEFVANGVTGWIPQYNFVFTNKPIKAGIGVTYTPNQQIWIMGATNYNNGPVMKLNNGNLVVINSVSNGWANITYNGKSGYVPTSSLIQQSVAGTNRTEIAYTTHDGGIWGFTEANGSNHNATIPSNTPVIVLSQSNGWSNICFNNTITWVPNYALLNKSDVSLVTDNVIGTAIVRNPNGPAPTTTLPNGNISSVSLPNGTKVNIYYQNDDCCLVNYNGGFTWIMVGYLI